MKQLTPSQLEQLRNIAKFEEAIVEKAKEYEQAGKGFIRLMKIQCQNIENLNKELSAGE